MTRCVWLFVVLLLAVGCTEPGTSLHTPLKVTPAPYGKPFEKLSEWHLFSDGASQQPASRVVPYSVIAPLFSDYTHKWRFMYVPPNTSIRYDPSGVWEFPEGTILVKTFAHEVLDARGSYVLRETRLLYREPDGWTPHTYVWDDDQKDAVRTIAGKFIEVDIVDGNENVITTNYRVPNTNECKTCHATNDVVQPLGPTTRQLNSGHKQGGENQIDYLASIGWLDVVPPPIAERETLVNPEDETQDLYLRVRSYWDANCAACHRDGVEAEQTGLFLGFDKTAPEQVAMDDSSIGICKTPTSPGGATCGNSVDIMPGDPDASVMICRMSVDEPKFRMPPLGSLVVHQEGLALMREWIASLEPRDCGAN